MKFIPFTLLALGIYSITLKGQNLIPNSSFEEYSNCPTYAAQINQLKFWFNPAIYPGLGGTPDYFNVCATPASHVDIPSNLGGYQVPHTGMGYSGFISYNYLTNYNYHEFIEVRLISELVADTCYRFEMYVSLANNSPVTTDAIGIYFSDTIISGINSSAPLPFIPQISNTNGFITDTLNWSLISAEYIAEGGENYLIIGNFMDDSITSYIKTNSCCLHAAYFYIDDVSLVHCSFTGLNNDNFYEQFVIYPNPMDQSTNIEFFNPLNENCTLTLYNVQGQVVRNTLNIRSGNVIIERQNLTSGPYFFQIRSTNQIIAIGKLIII